MGLQSSRVEVAAALASVGEFRQPEYRTGSRLAAWLNQELAKPASRLGDAIETVLAPLGRRRGECCLLAHIEVCEHVADDLIATILPSCVGHRGPTSDSSTLVAGRAPSGYGRGTALPFPAFQEAFLVAYDAMGKALHDSDSNAPGRDWSGRAGSLEFEKSFILPACTEHLDEIRHAIELALSVWSFGRPYEIHWDSLDLGAVESTEAEERSFYDLQLHLKVTHDCGIVENIVGPANVKCSKSKRDNLAGLTAFMWAMTGEMSSQRGPDALATARRALENRELLADADYFVLAFDKQPATERPIAGYHVLSLLGCDPVGGGLYWNPAQALPSIQVAFDVAAQHQTAEPTARQARRRLMDWWIEHKRAELRAWAPVLRSARKS